MKLRFAPLVMSAAMLVAPLTPVFAATAPANGSGQGLEISPPVVELDANPGQTIQLQIRLRNVTAGEVITKGKADDFGAGDETGNPKILLNEVGETRYSLKTWVKSVPDLDLAPQEQKTEVIDIAVPKNAEPGGHYGVVRFTAVPPNLQGTGVALSASIGTLVLLRVSGNITDKMSVAEFYTSKPSDKQGGTELSNGKKVYFFEKTPVIFVERIKNEGSVHEKPQGRIDIYNSFGTKVGTVAVNQSGGNVLPGADGQNIRRFEQSFDKKGMFGHYTAKLDLVYHGSQRLNASIGFWVIPVKLVVIVLLIIIVLFLVLRYAIKKYNQHILAQARQR